MKENKTKRNTIDPHCHVGEIHGVYKIIDVLDEKDKYGHYTYVGECIECGYKKHSHYGAFSGEKSRTIKCNHLTADGGYIQDIKWNNHRIQNIFHGMKQRCYNKEDKSYRWYGAKRIKVCDEWLNNPLSFEEWSLQNGYQENLSIDRIDENKDYSPDNCRWISFEENSQRAGNVNWITIDNQTMTGRQWSEALGFGVNIINKYIKLYGLENTIEFIKRYKNNPNLRPYNRNQSIYSLYMHDLGNSNSNIAV